MPITRTTATPHAPALGRRPRRLRLAVAATLPVLFGGCALFQSDPYTGGGTASGEGPLKGDTITVGSKNFTEQQLLCEITAQRLESLGATVKRTCGMSGSAAVRAALISGDIDLYWEYTGTGWLALQQKDQVRDPEKLYTQLAALDKARNKIIWLPPAEANNTYAVAVKADTATKLGVTTVSQYAKLANSQPSQATFCGASEFFGRTDGWAGLEKAYGFTLPNDKTALLAEGPIYNSISKGNPCNFGEVFATDGRIVALKLKVLDDDKSFFPPYNLSLNVREATLDKYPRIETVMAPVSKMLDTETLQKLNAQIDVDGKSPSQVAQAWLTDTGLN